MLLVLFIAFIAFEGFSLTLGKSWPHLKGVGDPFLPRTSCMDMWQRAWLTMVVVDGDDILPEQGAVERVVAYEKRQKRERGKKLENLRELGKKPVGGWIAGE